MAVKSVQATEDSVVQEAIETSERIEALIARAESVLSVSQQTIEIKIEEYDQSLLTSKRLEYNHITYGSRITGSLESTIAYNPEQIISTPNPWSLDLRKSSLVTAWELDNIALKGTLLEGLGKDFINAELEYGVNAMFLVSLAIHESGWGRSAIARDKNNLFGFAAYDSSPYLSATTFPSKAASIRAAANLLSGSYLVSTGRYYRGGYTASHVNKLYASDPGWASKIGQTMRDLDNKIQRDQNLFYHEDLYLLERGGEENGFDTFSALLRAQNSQEKEEE